MANFLQKWFYNRQVYVTITNVDSGSLKSFHTLFAKYFDFLLPKFEQIVWFPYIQNWSFSAKKGYSFLRKCWRHFEKRFCHMYNYYCLMLKYQLEALRKGTVALSDKIALFQIKTDRPLLWYFFYLGNSFNFQSKAGKMAEIPYQVCL